MIETFVIGSILLMVLVAVGVQAQRDELRQTALQRAVDARIRRGAEAFVRAGNIRWQRGDLR